METIYVKPTKPYGTYQKIVDLSLTIRAKSEISTFLKTNSRKSKIIDVFIVGHWSHINSILCSPAMIS